MTDLPTIALAITLGFQSGCIATWRYHKNQRDEQDTIRRQYEHQIERLERDLSRVEIQGRRRGRTGGR